MRNIPYKTALSLGDVVRLKREERVGLCNITTTFAQGTEIKIVEKDKYIVTGEDQKGRQITWLLGARNPDWYIDYVGREFSS